MTSHYEVLRRVEPADFDIQPRFVKALKLIPPDGYITFDHFKGVGKDCGASRTRVCAGYSGGLRRNFEESLARLQSPRGHPAVARILLHLDCSLVFCKHDAFSRVCSLAFCWNSFCFLLEAVRYETCPFFLHEIRILHNHLRSMCILQSSPKFLLISSSNKFSCHGPDSNPKLLGSFSQHLTSLNIAPGILHFRRPRFLSCLPRNPRPCMRHNQSRTVE